MKFVKIKEIKKVDSESVYHLTIKKNHNFFANKLCVHNCSYRGDYQYRFRAIPISYGTDLIESVPVPDRPGFVRNEYEKILTYDKFPYQVGDRVGQICLEEVIPIEFEQVNELSDTERGDGGFGSTGK